MSFAPEDIAAARVFDGHNRPATSSVQYSDLIGELLVEVDPRTTAISSAAPEAMAFGAGDGIHKASVIGGYVTLAAGFFGTAMLLLKLFA